MPEEKRRPGVPGRFLRWWRSRRYVVEDESMRPAFWPGDRLYAEAPPRHSVRPGDVVIARDPERGSHLVLKRIAEVRETPCGTEVELRGDNAPVSRDSRQFGPVPVASIVGLVWYRYAPEVRRGSDPGRHL